MFQCLTPYHGGTVTFRGNQKGLITWVGKIGIHLYPFLNNVLFVEGLKHNFLNISQLCGNGCDVSFNKDECIVQNKDVSLLFFVKRKGNLYKIRLGELSNQNVSCLLPVKENHWVWHKKLGYASLRLISKLQKHNLDLFGPTTTTSVSRKRYGLVVVDDYSRWTRVMFLTHNDESFNILFKFC